MRGSRRAAALLLLSMRAGAGFFFSVKPGAQECFDEHAAASDHVQGQWTISKHEMLSTPQMLENFAVKVTSPSGELVYSTKAERQGTFDYYATAEGTYVVCFVHGATEGESLSLSAKIVVGDPPDLIQLAKTEHLSPIEERIKNLHESMNQVRDLQDQMREQDEAQAKMTSSTRKWLLYFTLIEATVLVGVTVWQNLYLKSFFEVKRVV